MNILTALPLRPSATSRLSLARKSAGIGDLVPSTMNGGSYTASFPIAETRLAASRASAEPDDVPCTNTVSPAIATSASMSSTSRSAA